MPEYKLSPWDLSDLFPAHDGPEIQAAFEDLDAKAIQFDAYREELTDTVLHTEQLQKQSGGPGLYARMTFEIGPADPEFLESEAFLSGGQRLQLLDETTGGAIDKEFLPAIRKGFLAAMDEGVREGHPLRHLKVRLLDGKMHDEDSKPLAFELCARDGFRAAAAKASSFR